MFHRAIEEGTASWLIGAVTYLAHSTAWILGAWLLARYGALRAPRAHNLVWRMALVVPLLTTPLQLAAGPLWSVRALPATEITAPAPLFPTPLADGRDREARARARWERREARQAREGRRQRRERREPPPSPFPWSTLVGLAAFGVAAGRLGAVARRARRMQRLIAGRVPATDRRAIDIVDRLVRRSVRRLDVHLSVAEALPGPVALRGGEICLPPRALADLDDRALEAVLAHEVAHVERRDNLWLAIGAVVEAVLFLQPLNRLARRRLQQSAEVASDERAVELTGDAMGLARSLAEVARWGLLAEADLLASPVVSDRGALIDRVRVLLDPRRGRRWAGPLAAALLAAVVFLLPGLTGAVAAPPEPVLDAAGLWLIDFNDQGGSVDVELRIASRRDGVTHSQISVAAADLQGLTPARAFAGGPPVTFAIRRDAGTFRCEGIFRNGRGAGSFDFQPDPAFAAALRQRGYDVLSAGQQLTLALQDVGLTLIDELDRLRYARPTIPQLVRLAQHGVRLGYLQGMGAAGYTFGTVERLTTLRDHGVTIDFITALGALGYTRIPAEDLVPTRDHGVTPDYVRAMRDAGAGTHTLAELRRARDHGVRADDVRAWRALGYDQVPLETFIRARDHGVTPDHARRLSSGAGQPSIDELIRRRDRGED